MAIAAAALLAMWTPIGSAPDESQHLAAVSYFQNHLWPPDPASPEIWRSPHGITRTTNREWSYWLMGRLSGLAGRLAPALAGPRAIRWLDVAALAALLAPLLFWPSRLFRLDLAAAFLATIPQLLYLTSYVNGDAWAVVAATWLLRAALAIFEDDQTRDRWLFALALGLALGAKPNAWIVVPFAAALALARPSVRSLRRWTGPLVLALALVAPLRIAYPLLQPDFAAREAAARSASAQLGLDPAHPTAPGFRLRRQGAGFVASVAGRLDWWKRTAGSSYAFFGSMDILPPMSYFALAALAWLALLGINLVAGGGGVPRGDPRRAILVGAAFTFAALVAASLWYSWTLDYQPQGRYLFPALLPFALLVVGLDVDGGARRWRIALLALLALLVPLVLASAIPRL